MTNTCELATADAVILAQNDEETDFFAETEPNPTGVEDRALLPHLLDQLADAGFRRVIVSTDDGSNGIRNRLGTSYQGMELVYPDVCAAPTDVGRGNASALRRARPLVNSGAVLVLDAGSYCPIDLLDLWDWHHVRPAHLTIATPMVTNAESLQPVWVDENQRILRIMGGAAIEGPGLVNGGIYLMHTPLIERIPEGTRLSLHHDLLARWVEAGGVFGYPTSAPFLDTRTPERAAQAQGFFRVREEMRRKETIPALAYETASNEIVEPF